MLQNTKEWLEWRRNKVGASDAPIIMNVSPWKTPYQLWQEKVLWITNERSSHAMERGKNMEEKARHSYEEKKGMLFFPKVCISDENDWLIASMDGLTADGKHGVEIKCPGKDAHQIALNGKVPDYYYPQLQHQIYVCNLPKIDYFSYDGTDGVIVEVAKDIRYLKEMLHKELEFYECMRSGIPPAMTDRDFINRFDDAWSEACREYREAKLAADAAQECVELVRQKLISLSGEYNTQGSGIKLTKSIRQGQVDYSSIPELKDVNLDAYRKKSITSFMIREY